MSPPRRPIVVLKVGGAIVARPDATEAFAHHASRLVQQGARLVIVHGGGELIAALHDRLGIATVKHGGLRATPEDSIAMVAMALRGTANLTLVSGLVSLDLPAIGLSGADLGLMRSAFINRERLGRVGGPPRVAASPLMALLDQELIPVIAPLCLGPDGGLLNVNADTAAHAIAVALGAERLEFISDIPGVLDGEGRVRQRIPGSELEDFLSGDHVRGGMIPKLQASLTAVSSGVGSVRIGNLATLASGRATEVTP